jgi:hypothetical protein
MSDDLGGDLLADPALWLADWGQPVATPYGSGQGVMDQTSRLLDDRRTVTTDYQLSAAWALLEPVAVGDGVTVGGVEFRAIRPPLRASDGVLGLLLLERT